MLKLPLIYRASKAARGLVLTCMTILQFSTAQVATNFAPLVLGATVTVGTSLVATEASAQPGYRVCVSYDQKYFSKVAEEHGCSTMYLHSKFKAGAIEKLTCEAYALKYTKWGWDPCYSMAKSLGGAESEQHVYTVSLFAKDGNWKTGSTCGASSCGVSFGWSIDTTSSGGLSGAILGVGVSYGLSTNYGTSQGVSCTWKNGEVPGIQLYNMTNKTDVNGLLTNVYCGTQGTASDELAKEKTYGSTFSGISVCPGTGVTKTIAGKNYLVGALETYDTGRVSYASATQMYDGMKSLIDSRNTVITYNNGKPTYTCYVQIKVDVPTGWRVGTGYTFKTTYKRRVLTLK